MVETEECEICLFHAHVSLMELVHYIQSVWVVVWLQMICVKKERIRCHMPTKVIWYM